MSGTKIIRCNCDSVFQDEKYGLGKRVHNKKADKDIATCTVCGNEKSFKK